MSRSGATHKLDGSHQGCVQHLICFVPPQFLNKGATYVTNREAISLLYLCLGPRARSLDNNWTCFRVKRVSSDRQREKVWIFVLQVSQINKPLLNQFLVGSVYVTCKVIDV